ncbi:MAG: AraC family transcriptional regulator, partial [Clostridia bacterium]|nr:AraC family transcriptional regulator [Clostridia bacterium]
MLKNRTERISNATIDRIYAETTVRQKGFAMLTPHCHPYFELFYVHSAECRFFIDNNVYGLGAGDFLLIPPEVFHYTRYLSGECKKSSLFFRGEDVDGSVVKAMPQEGGFFTDVRIFQTPETFRGQIDGLILKMAHEEKIADRQTEPMLHALLQELLLSCARECNFPHGIPLNIHTTDRQIVLAAQFISNRYGENITAEDIAAAAGYSPNYLSRKFKESTGVGIHEYLTFIRLQKAAVELVSTKDSVTD